MQTLLKHLRPAATKTIAAAYIVVASASPIHGVASAAPMTMDEALDSITQPKTPEVEPSTQEISLSPSAQALLETIAVAEGTWDSKDKTIQYSMRFADPAGQGSLNIDGPHPRQIRGSRYGSGFRSDAAGAYQFLSTTWIGIHRGVNQVMTPDNQDQAALHLVKQAGYDLNRPFKSQAYKLAGTWASIPNRHNVSTYGQPIKSLHLLSKFHKQRITIHKTIAKAKPVSVACYTRQTIIKSSFA